MKHPIICDNEQIIKKWQWKNQRLSIAKIILYCKMSKCVCVCVCVCVSYESQVIESRL